MKKKVLIGGLIVAISLCLLLIIVFNFGQTPGGEEPLNEFTGITLESDSVVYDGRSHSLAIQGTLPENTAVTYQNNGQTNAGTYEIGVTLTKEGYKTLTLKATLTIKKAQFPDDITLESARFLYNGKSHSLSVTGSLPENTEVVYENNDKTEKGTYTVTATLTNINYETKKLTATLEIYTVTQAATEILSDILDRPEPWNFLPDAFSPERMAYTDMPLSGADFAADTNVSMIASRPIGRQLNVLYDGLVTADTALKVANVIFTAGETIISVYQNFIDKNPDDFDCFTGEAEIAGEKFRLRITLDGDRVTLLAGNDIVSVELVSDRSAAAEFRNEGRIQISDGIALKYQMSDSVLKMAMQFTMSGIGVLQQIEFVREGDKVKGSLYEFYGAEEVSVKTSALLYSDENVTAIFSDKRENADMPIDTYAELYDSKTGKMLGGEVTETELLTDTEYNTLWFNLYDVAGLISVRVTDETNPDNNLNANSVYVNGAETTFVPEFNTILFVNTSRHYDIEMKTVWYYVAVTEQGETIYEKREATIPMLFVQRENADSFSFEVCENNRYIDSAVLPSSALSVITEMFDEYSPTYLSMKENVTFGEIVAYIGENNRFFDEE